MIRVLIVDDEAASREGLELMLAKTPECQIIGQAKDGREAVQLINDQEPDLVLLDIQMPELDGFGVVREIGADHMPLTIFITAHDDFALKAFEVCALDYILKPYSPERLHKALNRAAAQLATPSVDQHQQLNQLLTRLAGERPRYADRLMIQDQGGIYFVDSQDIAWIEAADYLCLLHVGDRGIAYRESLKSLEEKLDPAVFARVHKSAIVNVNHIKMIKPQFHGAAEVILKNGDRIQVSRRRKKALLENPAFRYGI